jgi:hypothetical protein
MPFHFTCPYCFKKTLVDESLAGESGPCVNCGKAITVPEPPAKHSQAMRPVESRTVETTSRSSRTLLAWTLKVVCLLVAAGLLFGLATYTLWPTYQGLKIRRDKVASMNNLQLIARALNQYAVEYGTYPPPTVYDSKGKPLYSWRVLILTYLGEAALYGQFKLDQPWDSPHNIQFVDRCPEVFTSPAGDVAGGAMETNYVLITGRGTLFPPSGPLRPGDISDGAGNTLLVVETENTNMEWTRPWDIDIGKLNPKVGSTGSDTIGGIHKDGAAAVFADEKAGWLPTDLSPTILRSLITPAGGEPVDPRDYQLQ